MAGPYLKLYRIKATNVWPYEDVTSVQLVERKARATLTADMRADTTYRCYRRHPYQFVTIAPMEAFDESWEGASGPEISPYQLFADRPLALQIDYVLFQSWRAADYSKVEELIQRIKRGRVDLRALPKDLRPARIITMGDEQSDPLSNRRLEGTQPPNRPTSAFIVVEHSDLPYINEHTIPKGIDYEFVYAAIINYDFYEVPPTYDEVMKRMATYAKWFENLLSTPARTRDKRARRKRKAAGES